MRIAFLAWFAASAMAADLSGIWVGRMTARNNELVDIAFKLEQKGSVLTGKLYGDSGSSPVVEGKVEGDSVTFAVVSPEQAGNQINETRQLFTGSLKDGKLDLTRERQGSTNAGNGGGTQTANRPTAKTTLKLERLVRQ